MARVAGASAWLSRRKEYTCPGKSWPFSALGFALAGLILTSVRGLRHDMTRLESRLDGRIDSLDTQLGELRERMAHLEGLLEGLREAITIRAAAS